ncbi:MULTISPECIES: fatty acid desaturase [unclassified Mycobacterium]|uniref:fatty acid desaturase n=1 Tax=unclassified Mycobacterium TaxID=2642494 RepID=UPI002741EFAB|nr:MULTISPECIES: fatty acid desaturase [unclassified Mycobacterium]MDP7702539.1 cytochrome b5 domain-containing protein [Mycobacterium sp. TY815]MDP7721032.1 cytochrome b5 domain-containing protein [Mycobacterium sp. TY814]
MTNDLPEVQERGPGPHLGPPPGGPPVLPDVWVYNGRAYDLSDWISKHPGGAFFIGRTKNRDITAIIASYHRDPAVVERILESRYSLGREAKPRDIHPKHNAPPFLFKDDFNSWRDTPKYCFDNKDDLMHRVKARLTEPALAARIKWMDRLFNIVVALLAVAYFAVQGVRLVEPAWMPLWAFVIAMVLLRSSLVGYGHYALHRAQRGLNRVFSNTFDLNYIALALVVADGHTLLHHPYTQSDVDIKKNVFTMMMRLPRLYRVPVHTLHKFGHLVTGMAIRIADVWNMTRKVGVQEGYGSWRNALPHFLGSSGVRLMLVTEMVIFLAAGDFWAWALQFVATLWVSTFLVVASHEFEDDDSDDAAGPDWGVDQVEHANDLMVIGNRYVDCFLSAGLSSHRVHHVLPFQRSGFANIVTEDVLREEAAKSGVEWLPAKSFLTDRLPKLCRTYLLSPSRVARENRWGVVREHLSPAAFKESAQYVAAGFVGIGSV